MKEGSGGKGGIENRVHLRTPIQVTVKILSGDNEGKIYKTRDLSDGGIYLVSTDDDLPAVGEVIDVQVQGMGGADAPILSMEVVRQGSDGVGMRFV